MSDWLSTSHPLLIHSVVQNHVVQSQIVPKCLVQKSMMPRLQLTHRDGGQRHAFLARLRTTFSRAVTSS